jgi:uncharacterized membrane protein
MQAIFWILIGIIFVMLSAGMMLCVAFIKERDQIIKLERALTEAWEMLGVCHNIFSLPRIHTPEYTSVARRMAKLISKTRRMRVHPDA